MVGELDGGNLYAFTLNMPTIAVDKLGLKTTMSCINWSPAQFSLPGAVNLGVNWGFVSIGASFGYGISGEMCEVCCDDGSQAQDYKAEINVSGSLTASASSWGGGINLGGGISGSVWVGAQGSLFASGSGALSLQSDGCAGGCASGVLTVQVQAGGSIALGGNLTYQIGWWQQSVGVYGDISGTVSVKKEWNCNMCNGSLNCSGMPVQWCMQAQASIHVNLAFNQFSWVFWTIQTCNP